MKISGRHIAAVLLALSLATNAIALGSWIAGQPIDLLTTARFRPPWPQSVTTLGLIAGGFLLAISDKIRAARVLWIMACTIALAALFQWLTGIELGTDRLFFPNQLAQFDMPHAGRPILTAACAHLLLSLSGIAATWSRRQAALLAGSVFALLGSFVVVALFEQIRVTAYGDLHELMAMFVSASLPLGIIFWLVDRGWEQVTGWRFTPYNALRMLLPSALLLPVLPTLIGVTIFERIGFPEVLNHVLIAVGNIAIVGALLYWASRRALRGEAERARISEALDRAAVAFTDLDGRITRWSAGCVELYGWSAQEAIGQNKYGLLHSRCDLRDLSGAMSGSGPVELVESRRDGTPVCTLERAHHYDTGDAVSVILTITNITERVAAVRALRLSEERFAAAVSAHELGVFEWDVLAGKIGWSPGTAQRLGLLPEAITDFSALRDHIDEADLQQVYDTIAETVKHRAPRFGYRYRLLSAPAGIRAVEGSARAYYDGDGNLVRVVGVILDISEREERERELRQREAQLRSILQTVPDAMLVVDEEGMLLEFSAAAEALWGYGADDVIGHRFTMLAPRSERERRLMALKARIANPTGQPQVFKAMGETAEGRRFPFEARSAVARTDGRVIVTIFVRDLTEQIETEERMSELNAEMAHVTRLSAMSELAADLAHELNQPLSATSNFLAASRMLLEKGQDIAPVSDLIRMAIDQTHRAGEIIRRMRAFMARGEVELRVTSLASTIRDAVDLVMVGTGALNIRVDYQLDPKVQQIFADRVQVQQVLVNLLRNAIDALRTMREGDRVITIRSHKAPNDMVEIEVCDSGPGIADEVLETLFSRFTSTKDATGGMGIGLSIARRIIEAHGGTLKAENRPGGGARFSFTLPVMEQGVEP